MGQKAVVSMTPDEFFAWQEQQDELFELVNGLPLQMMSGARRRHDRITMNLRMAVGNRLLGKSCSPSSQDVGIRISDRQIRRPELAIDCGPFIDDDYIASDPRAVFEVLSASTRIFDQTKKLEEYKSVASLRHILLIDADSAEIIAYIRGEDGAWSSSTLAGLDAVVDFADIGFSLPLAEIYRGLTFRPRPILVMPDEL